MVIIEEKYEARQRKHAISESENETSGRKLLPVKIGRIVKPSILKKEDVSSNPVPLDEEANVKLDENVTTEQSEEQKPPSFVDIYADQMAKTAEKRRILAVSASKILESPETEISRLKEMQSIIDSIDVRCQGKLWMFAIGTLCELFKDILPSYYIRIATEAEKKQRAKKETKQLRQHEEQMLSSYKHYLTYMERYLPKRLASLLKPFSVPKTAVAQLCCVVVRSFGELLVARPTFNFSQNIIRVLVPLMNSGMTEVSDLACQYLGTLFQVDKSQEVALEAVRTICRYVKGHKYSVRPEMIRIFLKLKIREVDFEAPAREREEKRLKRLKFKLLSKKEQKRQKELDKVNKQLEAAGAVENQKRKLTLQTSIVEQLFVVYFFVLKTATVSASNGADTPLLSAVLEGVANFSNFMSIDYYDDLFRTLGLLLESGKLSPHESLNCIRSAFRMMQGEGESLDVDPARFYRHLYVLLVNGDFSRWPVEDFTAMLDCLDFMLIKRRKHLSDERLFAFAKRIATAALSCSPDSAYSLSLISLLRSLFGLFPSLDRLLDSSPYRPGGIFRPEVEDPEHCSAEGSFLYELSLLQASGCTPLSAFATKFAQEHYTLENRQASVKGSSQSNKLSNHSVHLDTYARMSHSEIFHRHSLFADLTAFEHKNSIKVDEKAVEKPKAKAKPKKPKLVSNLVGNAPISSYNPKLAPALLRKAESNKPTDSKQWNRKARRSYRFGNNNSGHHHNNGSNKNYKKNSNNVQKNQRKGKR